MAWVGKQSARGRRRERGVMLCNWFRLQFLGAVSKRVSVSSIIFFIPSPWTNYLKRCSDSLFALVHGGCGGRRFYHGGSCIILKGPSALGAMDQIRDLTLFFLREKPKLKTQQASPVATKWYVFCPPHQPTPDPTKSVVLTKPFFNDGVVKWPRSHFLPISTLNCFSDADKIKNQ